MNAGGTPALAIDHHHGFPAAVLTGDFQVLGGPVHGGRNMRHIPPDSTAAPDTLIHEPDHTIEASDGRKDERWQQAAFRAHLAE
jgi:hypothetical protein